MELRIESTLDAGMIAELNRAIQEHHCHLYPEVFKPHDSEAVRVHLASQLEDPAWHCHVAWLGGRAVGYVLFYIREYQENPFRHAYRGVQIDQISVEPEMKRQGIGRALMADVEAFARQEGASQLELTCWALNEEAHGFYEQQGFGGGIRFVVKPL